MFVSLCAAKMLTAQKAGREDGVGVQHRIFAWARAVNGQIWEHVDNSALSAWSCGVHSIVHIDCRKRFALPEFEVFKVAEDLNGTPWLSVIGKALAYLCVQHVSQNDPERVGSLLDKVKFLEGIGVPKGDAALILGSTTASVATLESRKKRGASNGRKKTKR